MLLYRMAQPQDLPEILQIYARARRFMAEQGNPTQWGDSHPPRELLQEDIRLRRLYISQDAQGIACVFALLPGEDPTYRVIRQGAWHSDGPYWVVHRIASSGRHRGAAREALRWCCSRHPHVRIDTHADNLPMRRALADCGFTYCGIIHLQDGSPRLAFEKWQ